MSTPKAMQQSFALRFSSGAFLAFWCLLASFPIFWIAVMSFKSPVDAFAASPWDVITGPATRANGDGLSVLDILVGLVVLYFAIRWAFTWLPGQGLQMKVDGNVRGVIPGEDFASVFFRIWLGPRPPNRGLRRVQAVACI